jgi:hypothetical protein
MKPFNANALPFAVTTSLALSFSLPVQAASTFNAPKNVNAIQLTQKTSTTVTTVALTNSTGHLVDFSNTDRQVVGAWVDNPEEFSKSFKFEPVGGRPNVFAVNSVVGGSSNFTVNLLTLDSEGNQRIQPLRLTKELSSKNITQFYEPIPQAKQESVPTDTSVSADSVAALEQGAKVAMEQGTLDDPELQSRVEQLVAAVKAGESIEEAAPGIGLSQSAVSKLMALGTNPQAVQ